MLEWRSREKSSSSCLNEVTLLVLRIKWCFFSFSSSVDKNLSFSSAQENVSSPPWLETSPWESQTTIITASDCSWERVCNNEVSLSSSLHSNKSKHKSKPAAQLWFRCSLILAEIQLFFQSIFVETKKRTAYSLSRWAINEEEEDSVTQQSRGDHSFFLCSISFTGKTAKREALDTPVLFPCPINAWYY